MKKEYNWWTDPKNKKEAEKLSWWNHSENKIIFNLPISIIKNDNNNWTATCSDETKKFLGDRLHGIGSGKTKKEAIEKMFKTIRILHWFAEDSCFKYQRWVPFRKGAWGNIGGSWFVIFGIHVNFRYGDNMKYGRYIPFTKLNISIYSEWATYRKWKKNNHE